MKKIPWIVKQLLLGFSYIVLLSLLILLIEPLAKYSYLAWLVVAIPLVYFYKKVYKKYDERYLKGLYGENDIQEELKKLPNGYVFIRNIETAKDGNIDFVVLGPNGIWVVEVKSHSGVVTFDGKQLIHNGRLFEKDFLMQCNVQKKILEQFIQYERRISLPVTPVIVFSNPKVNIKLGMKKYNGVYVIKKQWLLNLISNSDEILLTNNTKFEITDILAPFAKTFNVPAVNIISSNKPNNKFEG